MSIAWWRSKRKPLNTLGRSWWKGELRWFGYLPQIVDIYRSEVQKARINKLSTLLKRRFEIEQKMIKCGEEIEMAHEAARREFQVAVKGRISDLKEGLAIATYGLAKTWGFWIFDWRKSFQCISSIRLFLGHSLHGLALHSIGGGWRVACLSYDVAAYARFIYCARPVEIMVINSYVSRMSLHQLHPN